MKNNLSFFSQSIGTLFLLLFVSLPVGAQLLRTSYFMEGATNRVQLNPALQPTRGYFNVPVVGMFNVSATSNSLGTQDIIDIIDSDDDFLNNTQLFDQLKADNRLNVSLNTDVLSFGFYKGKGFWTFNVGLRTDVNASIPKSMFEYMRDMDSEEFQWEGQQFDIRNQQLSINAYTEVGLGYSRTITDRLTVGGRLKFLAGVGNMNLDIKQMSIYSNIPDDWSNIPSGDIDKYRASIKTDARLESSFKGMELSYSQEPGRGDEIEDMEFDNFGIGGYGGAIDLGATYRLFNNLTLSAAILDLGFISWSKDATIVATANRDQTFNKDNYEEFETLTQDGDILLNYDLMGLKEEESKSRTTSLAPTLVLGGEYAILNNKVAFGVLSTTRFNPNRTDSELTLSANYRPKSWFNTALSYSMIQSLGKSFGLAVKLGPLMVGTDYMFLGSNSKSVNAYLGLSFPLGAKKKKI